MITPSSTSRLARAFGQHDIIVRSVQATDRLGEQDRLGRHGQMRLRRVIGIVEADRDEFANARDRNAEPRLTRDRRQRARIEFREPSQAGGAEMLRAQIGQLARKIAHDAVTVEKPGLLVARGSVTQ
jgi:hypothetical protein